MTENLDAMRALEHVPLGDRAAFKAALAATLVKHQSHRAAFDVIFDVYFALQPWGPPGERRPRGAGGRWGAGAREPGGWRRRR